jgi:hypothetical protein
MRARVAISTTHKIFKGEFVEKEESKEAWT